MTTTILVIITSVIFIFFSGVRIVRPTQRGLIERLGRYDKFVKLKANAKIVIPSGTELVNVLVKWQGCYL